MANPSKAKGSRHERRVVELLHLHGAESAYRLANNSPSHDIAGLSVPIEVKARDTWAIPAWSRAARAVHGGKWALFVAPKDSRRVDAPPRLMVVPEELGAALLSLWDEVQDG